MPRTQYIDTTRLEALYKLDTSPLDLGFRPKLLVSYRCATVNLFAGTEPIALFVHPNVSGSYKDSQSKVEDIGQALMEVLGTKALWGAFLGDHYGATDKADTVDSLLGARMILHRHGLGLTREAKEVLAEQIQQKRAQWFGTQLIIARVLYKAGIQEDNRPMVNRLLRAHWDQNR